MADVANQTPARSLRGTRRKLGWIVGVGVVLISGALGVRQWWVSTAPQRAAQLASIERRERTAQILGEARKGVAAAPRDWRAHDRLATALMAAGQPDEALASWRRGTEVAPAERKAWESLANAYLVQQKMAAAEETFRTISRRWPKDPAGFNGLAVAQRHQGRLREALLSARAAVQRAPGRPEPRYVLGTIIQELGVRSPFPQGQTALLEEARQHLLAAAKAMPDNPDPDFRRGRVCLLIRRFDEARQALQSAADRDPNRSVVWLALSEALMRTGRTDESIAAARKAVAVNPLEPEGPMALGRVLLLKSDPASLEEARAAFATAARLNPKSAQAWVKLGTALLRLDRVEEAGAAFETAYRLDRNDPYPPQQLAQIYQRVGKSQEAAQAARLANTLAVNERILNQLQRTCSNHPENPLVRRALANRYRELGWWQPAADEYEATLERLPNDPATLRGLAEVRRRLAEQSTQ